MDDAAGRRFGAIVWNSSAARDDAIQFVAACDGLDWAIQMAQTVCSSGEQWAVVDLMTMGIAARGGPEHQAPSRHPSSGPGRILSSGR